MCGIVGWFSHDAPLDVEALRVSRDRIEHRGPDDSGLFLSENGRAGLAFRRLSIIDLSPLGHQPMANEDETVWIIFNGEVYNFAEIRPELEARGHKFRSRTDTEVILHAYEEWGPACVDRFIGMFAFATWDTKRQTLFAARDRLGIKPLYYADNRHGLFLASELKALSEAPGIDRTVDPSAVYDFLRTGYVVSPRSIYQGVRQLPPGHTLQWRPGESAVIRSYWSPVDAFTSSRDAWKEPSSEEALVDQLDELLRSSVRYRLVSDVPIGAFLSGGIDSSAVVALMRQVSQGDVKSFTIRFEDLAFNEADHAAEVARHLGTEHHEMTVTTAEAKAAIPKLPTLFDEPYADKSNIPTLLLCEMTRKHVTVALSGDGGDELFAGYNSYALPERRAGLWRSVAPLRGPLRALAQSGIVPGDAGKQLAMLGANTATAMFDNRLAYWQEPELRKLAPSLSPVGAQTYREPAGADVVELCALLDVQRYLPDDILTKVDRTSMAVSLEARVPIIDHRVVEFALGVPLKFKRREGRGKWLLRHLLARYVPTTLTDRPKQGFTLPLEKWLRGELGYLLDDHLSASEVAKYGFLDPGAVEKIVRAFREGAPTFLHVWTLLSLQMWLAEASRHARRPSPQVPLTAGARL